MNLEDKKALNILNGICVIDKGYAFTHKYYPLHKRICLNCALRIAPEMKDKWWHIAPHHCIINENVQNQIRCIKCNRRLSNIRPAVACTECRNGIHDFDKDDEEAYETGVLITSEITHPIVLFENVKIRNGQLQLYND
ncbi:uncharacterized protein LOC143266664 [Megachile rotundata]|uniref:uncharacterized protein LOC143266664 n=1 Tax=Megachile rotundata TaxID=143995 RepID=UPI003FD5528B